MKKTILFSIIFFFLASFTISLTEKNSNKKLSIKERFALEIEVCNKAIARGKQNKCQLYGKIKWVTSFPDVKVKVVNSFPDIKVKLVTSFPSSPGKWQIVNSFPDYKVQQVTSFPDYKFKFITSFPGCR
jgi:hypothetical protein